MSIFAPVANVQMFLFEASITFVTQWCKQMDLHHTFCAVSKRITLQIEQICMNVSQIC